MLKIVFRRSSSGIGTTGETPVRYRIYRLVSLAKPPQSRRTKGMPEDVSGSLLSESSRIGL
jgi:hypothetical protein